MTSARRPAGAPEEEPRPAGAPPEPAAAGDSPEEPSAAEEAARVDADLDLLADVKRERDEYLELAKRARADFDNFRKRAARDAADAERRGKAAIARELIPAVDNLERALEADGGGDALRRGVELVHRELLATLERAGVERYDPAGEPFDPAWHEALSTRPSESGEAGVVLETVERGYRLDGQVIRPARVVVAD